MADTVDPSILQQTLGGMNNAAQMAYYQSKLQGDNDTLAFQKAQAAVALAGNLGTQYGYAPGGNWYTFGAGGPTIPPAGTPTQSTMNTLGSGGAIPGATGFNTGSTASYQSQLQSAAQAAAGLTGFYNAPRQSQFSPGTFVRIDPSTYDYATNGDQLDYVTPSGQLQRVTTTQAKQMGWNGSTGDLSTIPFSQAATLENAPPQYLPQQTMQGQQAYQSLNSGANTNALATAAATGMYQAPAQIYAPGTNAGGGKFQDLDQGTQQAYFYSNGGDWTAAMNKWVADSNNALKQATEAAGGTWNPNQPGTPQETLAAQKQAADIANQQAGLTGYYNAPTMYAPGTYVQDPTSGSYYQVQSNGQMAPIGGLPQGANAVQGTPGVSSGAGQQGQMTTAYQQQVYQQWLDAQKQSLAQWQAQQTAGQNYLTMMAGLRGPADYAKYQQVLGATPGGMKDLVAAAAGQYIPGGGATTGVAPTPVTLQNFVGSATGQQPGDTSDQAAMNSLVAPNQMAPQTWNALTPSQQQMLLGTWESQGYTKDDAQALFNQSLPKYATQSAAAGSFKLQ